MKATKTQIISRIFTLILIVFIFLSSLLNAGLLVGAITTTIEEKSGFQGFVENTKSAYVSNDFRFKNSYININGLFAKLTGRTVYNDVATLKNGMLINANLGGMNTEAAAKSTAAFRDFIEKCGGQLLFVQAPYKLDINNELLPTGVSNSANTRADNMLLALKSLNVDTLDLRQTMATDSATLKKYFYVTDHHWNTAGGFYAYTQICEKINSLFKEKTITNPFADINNWNITTYENWFLGSQGKRVGIFFAGIDDLDIYEPKFDTKMSSYIVNHSTFKSGSFSDVNVIKGYLDKPNYFADNAYCSYIGGDYPLVQNRNAAAPVKLRVLVLKDSFTLPVQAFLTTTYSEVDVIDPRYFDECELAEYVECTRPDVVVMLINPWSMEGEGYYSQGIDSAYEYLNKKAETVYESAALTVTDKVNISNTLKPNTKYTISVAGFTAESDTTAAIFALCDSSGKAVTSRAADIDYCENSNGYSWSFVTPESENDLQLIVYSNPENNTSGNSLVLNSVSFFEYK